MKTPAIIFFLVVALFQASGQTAARDAAVVRKQSEALAAMDKKLEEYSVKLLAVKQELVEIRYKAQTLRDDNAARVFVKGGIDMAAAVTAPSGLGGAYELLVDVFNNLTTEESLWNATVHRRKVPVDSWKNEVAGLKTHNKRLAQLCNVLIYALKADLRRFDDDLPALPAAEAFWRRPDGKDDDDIELITRKLTVIKGLAGVIINDMEAEVKRAAAQRKRIQAERQAITALLADVKNAPPPEKPEPDNTPRRPVTGNEREDRDTDHDRRYDDMTTDRQPTAAELKERARLREEAERERKRKADERRRLEEKARVIIDPASPSTLLAGEYGYYLASIDPPLTMAGIEWYIDDRLAKDAVNDTASSLTAVFPKPGRHTIRAVLKIRGQASDQHIINVSVEEAKKPAKYPPELEGKKTLALDLGWCRYDALYKGGKIYLTGFYYTPQKQKINYTSLPVENFTPQAPAAGFLMTKTAGYHIYQTEAEEGETVYVITRMQGPEIKVLHRLSVRRFQMEIAKNYSTVTVKYMTDSEMKSGNWKIIILR
ncbi:MAG: hypothetical protein JXD23_17825 [Spirochaetales bacterium]|nr:hypothetical protein [Spirochaetales bacterium]